MSKEIIQYVNDNLYGVWYLIGAALVFWMQAGFAMVEAGFTRAKNAGNIIMKNLMDFCIGTFMFFLIGASLLLGNDMGGFIGKLDFNIFSHYGNYDYSIFVFNLVFCATTATIVSGAMAERTKFISYCVYSAVISAVIYPVEAHWTWGGGFLAQMGFHDFAGSNCIHMVGGICALIGAAILLCYKVISARIPLTYIGSFAVFVIIYMLASGKGFDVNYLLTHLCGGGLMLGAWFMATDYVTSPITPKGQYVYGVCLGVLTGIFRIFGASAEGVSYAIIFCNLLVPQIERFTRPVAFGKGGAKK